MFARWAVWTILLWAVTELHAITIDMSLVQSKHINTVTPYTVFVAPLIDQSRKINTIRPTIVYTAPLLIQSRKSNTIRPTTVYTAPLLIQSRKINTIRTTTVSAPSKTVDNAETSYIFSPTKKRVHLRTTSSRLSTKTIASNVKLSVRSTSPTPIHYFSPNIKTSKNLPYASTTQPLPVLSVTTYRSLSKGGRNTSSKYTLLNVGGINSNTSSESNLSQSDGSSGNDSVEVVNRHINPESFIKLRANDWRDAHNERMIIWSLESHHHPDYGKSTAAVGDAERLSRSSRKMSFMILGVVMSFILYTYLSHVILMKKLQREERTRMMREMIHRSALVMADHQQDWTNLSRKRSLINMFRGFKL